MMLLREFIQDASAALGRLYPFEEARSMVLSLVTDRLGIPPYTCLTEPDMRIEARLAEALEKDMERLLRAEPLQYVLGYSEFHGRRFHVTEATLIPRPETEMLCREALRFMEGRPRSRVLDLCTGSGCIAWTIAQENPSSEVFATDISEAALEVAENQGFPGNAPLFSRSDLLSEELPFPGEFDLIASNPPYIAESEKESMRENVLGYEPSIALFVPDSDPLVFYRAVASVASRRLAPGGLGIVEINERFPRETADVFRSALFQEVGTESDYFGKPRFVTFSK